MSYLHKFLLASISILLFASTAYADQKTDIANIKKAIAEQLKGVVPTAIATTPVKGLYQVTLPPDVYYMSGDGRYFFNGDMIDLKSGENLSQAPASQARLTALEQFSDSMIVYGPKVAKYQVTVFTDIDCGYCRKLHDEMSNYNKLGIQVRYLAYPRAGVGSESFNKAVSVWCAKDPNEALTLAKQGKPIKTASCDNRVAQRFQFGQKLGIRGTPAIMLPDGRIYPGYAPAPKLLEILDREIGKKKS